MFHRLFIVALLAVAIWTPAATAAPKAKPQVALHTSMGLVVLELNPQKAPKTVANFLKYVDEGFYDGTLFHRVISNFMIQGGGMTKGMKKKKTHAPITNEADNGLTNDVGTVAMARTGQPHSASSQFFINVKNNTFLNHQGKSPRGWGYCVFGKVIQGMDVVNRIKAVRTGHSDIPSKDVVIQKATRHQPKKNQAKN